MTTYHVLWELVHVFFEQPGVLAPGVSRHVTDAPARRSATTTSASPARTPPSQCGSWSCSTTTWPWSTPAPARKRSASRWSARASATRSWCTPGRPSRWCRDEPAGERPARRGLDRVALPVPVRRPDRCVRGAGAGPRVHGGQGQRDPRAAPGGLRRRRRLGWWRAPREVAARFAAGGRLLAFGNGGSATDAQQLVTVFLHPGGARPAAAGPRAWPATRRC